MGIVDLDHLILCKRVYAVFFAVYRDPDRTVMSTPNKIHSTPEKQGKDYDANDKCQFFFLQIPVPLFLEKSYFLILI